MWKKYNIFNPVQSLKNFEKFENLSNDENYIYFTQENDNGLYFYDKKN